jgi:hypothetical protein
MNIVQYFHNHLESLKFVYNFLPIFAWTYE